MFKKKGYNTATISATFHLIAASTEIDQCCAVGNLIIDPLMNMWMKSRRL